MPDKPSNLGQFWQELKRRKVVRVITVYAAAAWVILEFISNIEEPFELPDWTTRFVFVILCVGLIVSIILSWIYDITQEGIEKTKPIQDVPKKEKPFTSKGWKIASIISIIVIVALIVLNIIPRSNLSGKRAILEKSVAVIPFINDSPDQENAYFINGIMDELIINLQSIKDLRVPGRTSVEQYRNNPKPIPEIARELGVNYIVEASGQKYGNEFTLRVQLLEGATGMHLWGKPIRKDIESVEDIISIQSSMAKSIAEELQAVITPEEQQLIEKVTTTSLTAHDFYQRGREEYIKYMLNNSLFFKSSDNTEALERAEDLCHEALDYDSTFAQAYTGLALVYFYKHFWKTYLSENFLDSSLILANKALSFDNQLAEAYVIRGVYYWAHNDNKQAIKEYDKAININPNDWEAYYLRGALDFQDDLLKSIENLHMAVSLERGPFLPDLYRFLGMSYATSGFKEKAIYYQKEALKLDNDSALYYCRLNEIEDCNGNFKQAIEYGEKSYSIDSTDQYLLGLLGSQYMYLGQMEKSLKYIKKSDEELRKLDRPGSYFSIGYAFWAIGSKDKAEYYFNKGLEFHNEMIELGRLESEFSTLYLAQACAFLGDKDKAYENLRLFNQRPRMPLFVIKEFRYNPLFDNIRDEPEFQQIFRDIEAKYQAEHEKVKKWLEENDML
jgi:TolB-like protein/tetratricopeptide (TPR) repeat protein